MVERDGSVSASDWRGDRPLAEYPQSLNPAQGYLASANQQPVDPQQVTGYWGGSYDPWRALRINALLRADSSVTVDAMRRYQTDPGSERANLFVPRFLAAARRAPAGMSARDAASLAEAARLLGEWDRRYTRENTRAVLFEAAMRELVERTWDELIEPGAEPAVARPPSANADRVRRGDAAPVPARRVATPSSAALAQLLADSASPWWDDTRTAGVREDRDAIMTASLVAGLARARRDAGEPDAGGWTWSRVRHANVGHLLGLPGFGRRGVSVQGGPGTLSPSSGNGAHGASWRMVVEMGPQVAAWAVYPGGQSGNPASSRYADRLRTWQEGRLDSLVVPRAASEMGAGASVLTLRPRR
jgi:penicillin amidase